MKPLLIIIGLFVAAGMGSAITSIHYAHTPRHIMKGDIVFLKGYKTNSPESLTVTAPAIFGISAARS